MGRGGRAIFECCPADICRCPIGVSASRSGIAEPSGSAADVRWMSVAIEEAKAAGNRGEIPVGAVVVMDGGVVGRGGNASVSLNDPTAHAEVLALRAAGAAVGNYRLPRATLYATVEPCPMCMGSMLHARVARLVYGCPDPKGGAAGSVMDLGNNPCLNHRLTVTRGVLEAECVALLRRFFAARR